MYGGILEEGEGLRGKDLNRYWEIDRMCEVWLEENGVESLGGMGFEIDCVVLYFNCCSVILCIGGCSSWRIYDVVSEWECGNVDVVRVVVGRG